MTPDFAAEIGLPSPRVGPYVIYSHLGTGGTGAVYLARHSVLDDLVAIKFLRADRAADPRARSRFGDELRTAGRLRHPHLIRSLRADRVGDVEYLVMEYVEGVDLGKVLIALGSLRPADACEVARQVAKALVYLRSKSLLHGDIKPSNLLLGFDGRVRVLDLGLVRSRPKSPDAGPSPVMGSDDFVAPEQGLAGRTLDIRADIYSVGCTLYTLLAGHAPFAGMGADFAAKLRLHREAAVPPLKGPNVPPGLVRVVERMLAKDPDARHRHPSELVADLTPFGEGHSLRSVIAAVAGDETASESNADLSSPGRSPNSMPPRS